MSNTTRIKHIVKSRSHRAPAFWAGLLVMATLTVGCLEAAPGKPPVEKTFVAPDNPHIVYMGRVDFSNPKEPCFDWPGVSIAAVFEGTYCGIGLEDGKNDYNVFVDGKLFTVMVTEGVEDLYEDVCGLSRGTHSLLITKRTEGYHGVGIFKGLYLEKGKKLLPPPKPSSLRIEFIGDSITCGYGNESKSVNCDSLREFENNYLAYCAIASRELKADYSVIAISGKGVVRNYGDEEKESEDPMPTYYDHVLQNDSDTTWDFSSWIPQVVVINLGTNDYSTQPHPDKDVFIAAYLKLITRVRKNYPSAQIFCLCGTMATHPQCQRVQEVVKKSNAAGDKRVHYVKTPAFGQKDCGCHWHPNTASHKIIADALVKEIRKYL